jgi:hypothetical protein
MRRAWKPSEERQLIEQFKKGGCRKDDIARLARIFNRSPEAVLKKLQRLGLNVVAGKFDVTATFERPSALPSLEEALKIVAGALEKATEPGLAKTELQRLEVIAALYRAYESGLEKYVNYRAIEQKLIELEEKYAQLTSSSKKAEGHEAGGDSPPMVSGSAQ